MNKTGFGFLRLPRTADGGIDYGILNPMVDRFLELGGTYFDTAYTYLDGLSEDAIRKAVVERHPREQYLLADKLPGYQIQHYEECQQYFDEQLRRCGVDYFDVFLLHWLNEANYAIAEKHDEFRFLRELKKQGKARQIGFSYHDSPELLDRILSGHPEVDIVQLQINYLDWNSISLQAKELYQVAVKYGKKIVVMEPVKGGNLAKLPLDAEALLRKLHPEASPASWAIRFASGLEQVAVVLSGMNAMEQLEDNMRSMEPLDEKELDALEVCAKLIRAKTAVSCTGCAYCVPNCPQGVPIPQYFALYNEYMHNPDENWKMQHVYDSLANQHVRASVCIRCRKCEKHCPQGLKITEHLMGVANAFEQE